MKKITFIFIILLFTTTFLFAKKFKTATIDIEKVFQNANIKIEADRQMQEKEKKFKEEFDKMTKNILELERQYEVAKSSDVETETTRILDEIIKAKDTITKFEQQQSEMLKQDKKNFEYNIHGEIYDKIKEIAKQFKYDIIFNKKDIIYTTKEDDITDFVITQLNEMQTT